MSNLPFGRTRVVDPAELPGTVRAVVEHTPTCQCQCQDKTPQVLETTCVVREDGSVFYKVVMP